MAGGNERGFCCSACQRKINRYDDVLKCTECLYEFHIKCVDVTVEVFEKMRVDKSIKQWRCGACCVAPQETNMAGASHNESERLLPSKNSQNVVDDSNDSNKIEHTFSGANLTGKAIAKKSPETGHCVDTFPADVKVSEAEVSSILSKLDVLLDNQKRILSEPSARDCGCRELLQALYHENIVLKGMLREQASVVLNMKQEFTSQIAQLRTTLLNSSLPRTGLPLSQTPGRLAGSDNRKVPSAAGKTPPISCTSGVTDSAGGADNTPIGEIGGRIDDEDRVAAGAAGDVALSAKPAVTVNDHDGFTRVQTRKKRWRAKNTVTGTRPIDNSATLKATEKRMWLFVGRTCANTTEDRVLKYLNEVHKSEDFTCERLETKSTNYPCFKVSAPIQLKEAMESADSWPDGVVVRRFDFHSGRNRKAGDKDFRTAASTDGASSRTYSKVNRDSC